ncbi:MAG: 16S rRNA (uracil(1498)-N(3))-methyltransferase [Desulfuromonadaceae bacterium]|nr:16S rRNA (uracil(1498)-N(3))-methyltransferase [Desulfuromonadaceae bacterium]
MNQILLFDGDFIDQDRVCVRGRRAQHIQSVLGSAPQDVLRVGRLQGGQGRGIVESLDSTGVTLRVELDMSPPPPSLTTLLLALPRPKVLKRLLVHVTTLGIKRIILFNSWRVDKSYWKSPLLTPAALREPLLLGLEQARDTLLPEIELKRLFKPFVEDELEGLGNNKLKLLAHPGGSMVCPCALEQEHLLIIGPEGGLIPYEVDLFTRHGCTQVSAGRRILHVETAVAGLIGRLSV